MDIRDSQRIKRICDNTEKMADAFTRIADALERLTEPSDSENPNDCDTCKHRDEPFDEFPCDRCCKANSKYEPKTEPNSSEEPNNCEDEPQTHMTEDDAFYIVYKDLTKDEGVLTGRYDARNGSEKYMYGICSVMEYIAYRVGKDCYDAFTDRFAKNMTESQEKSEKGE